MKNNIKLSLILFVVLGFLSSSQAQTTTQSNYSGNGNSGFGGAIGQGSLLISNNASGNLSFTLTKGPGGLADAFVIYFDTVAGGITSTSSLNDQADGLRSAISGSSGGNTGLDANSRSLLSFQNGFAADYAFAMNTGFAAVWQLATGGNNSLIYKNSANLNSVTSTSSTFTFNFNVSEIGMTANSGQSFNFVGSYLNAGNSFRSDEAFGFNPSGGNPGNGGIGNYPTTTVSSSLSFQTVPEPSSASLMALGTAGLLALRRRRQA